MGIFDGVKSAFTGQSANMLTAEEASRFDHLKQRIRDGIKAWHAAGKALVEIRDRQLYRAGYKTFEEFASGEFGLGERRIRQMIEAATTWEETASRLPPGSPQTPPVEQVVRDLKTLPADERPAAYMEAAAAESAAAGRTAPPKPKTMRRVIADRNARAGRRTTPKPMTIRVPGGIVRITWNSKGSGDAAAALAAAAAWIARADTKAA